MQLLKLLSDYNDNHNRIARLKTTLTKENLAGLFKLKEFREMMETENWNETLELCTQKLENACVMIPNAGTAKYFIECSACRIMWSDQSTTSCPFCHDTRTCGSRLITLVRQ